MDQITLLILTVTLNALVTGLVVYIVQKRIEHSYANRLFQDQLKIKRRHEKTSETLETLYKMFSTFSDELMEEFWGSYISRGYYRIDSGRLNPYKQTAEDIKTYFETNRIFVPDLVTKEVFDICVAGGAIVDVAIIIFIDTEKAKGRGFYSMVNDYIQYIGGVDDLNLENPDYEHLRSQIMKRLEELKLKLEKIYKLNS